jgi:ribosomal protein S14
MGVAGDPDLYGSVRGRHFEIEVKRPDAAAESTELQRQRLREWEQAGAIVGVARSVEDALAILADAPGLETAESQRRKMPARSARKPNADEQAGDWGGE